MILELRIGWSQENPPTASEKTPDDSEAPAVPPEQTFAINGFQVEGNTVLPSKKVDKIISVHTGPNRRFSDVEAARAELEAAYHEAGYPTVLVIVPEQTIEGGIIKLQVVESKLGQIEIVGNRHFLQRYILDRLPSLRPGAILYEPTVMAELNRLSSNPDLKITPVLSVGETPGTVDLKLQVEDRLPLHASLEWNNRGTPNTPRQRLSGTIQYNNLFDRDHIITLQTTQTPQDWGAVAVYSLSYVIPFSQDQMIAVYGAVSKSNSVLAGAVVSIVGGELNVAGDAVIIGGRYIFPLSTSDQLSLGVDYKRLGKNEATFPGEFGTALITNRVYYTPMSVAYTGSRFDENGTTRFSASVRGYIAGMVPGGDEEDFGGSNDDPIGMPGNRKGSTGTFAVFQAGVERSQPLPKGFLLSGKLDGQVSTEPLISAEQYFAGGIDTVRGYRENEALGDDAIHWMLDLFTPPLGEYLPEAVPAVLKKNVRLTAFYDAAYLFSKEIPQGQLDHQGLTGMGFGIRLGLTDYIQVRLDQAWAFRDGPVTREMAAYTHFLVRGAF